MKAAWIAFALIIACSAWGQSQQPPPDPTKQGSPVQKTTSNKGSAANQDQRGTEDRPLFVKVSGVPIVEVHGGPQAEQKPAESPEKKDDGTPHNWWFKPDALTAWFTGALVFIGFVTGGVLICQSILLRRQVNLAREEFNTTSRAFVFIDGFNTLLFTEEDVRGPAEDVELADADRSTPKLPRNLVPTFFSIQPRWKNAGSTPTKNLTTKVNWRPLELKDIGPLEFTYKDQDERHFLGPKSIETSTSIEIPTVYPTNLIRFMCAMPQIDRVGSAEYANFYPWIIVWGRADYLDIFDKPHFTEWCYRIEFACPDGKKLSTRFTQWGEHNRTDHDAQQPQTGGRFSWLRARFRRL
jgi:hypothetical protein